jgi:hypothetical protein
VWIAFRHISRYRDLSQLMQMLYSWSPIVHVELLFRAREPADAYISKGMLPTDQDDVATIKAKELLILQTKQNRKKVLARGFNWFTITVSPPEIGQPPETQMVTSKVYNKSYRFMRLPISEKKVIRLWQFCYAQKGKTHNSLGNKYNFMSCGYYKYGCRNKESARESESWFCSELVVAALQQVGLCSDVEPCMVTPAQVLRLVTEQFQDRVQLTQNVCLQLDSVVVNKI